MFYSSRTQAICSDRSHIEFDRVFCGQYWDEYGCVGFLGGGDSHDVLLLGVGDGAAIRSILSSSQTCQLTCIDLDGKSLADCRKVYTENFPQLNFVTIKAEAGEYIKRNADSFDVIVVDLYTRWRYAPVVFSEEFHDLLLHRLKPGGHLLFNAYGIPMHLKPFEGKSAQAFLARMLIERWGCVRYLPYRRNATLIVGAERLPNIDVKAKSSLRLADRLTLELLQLRVRSMRKVTVADAPFDPNLTTHSAIDEEMRRRWKAVVPQIDSLTGPTFRVTVPTDLLKLIQDSSLCSEILNRLAEDDHELLPLLPIFLAGEFNNRDIEASWLIDWTFEFLGKTQSKGRQRFIDFCLPQVLSIVINGKNKYRSKIFAFKECIEALRESGRP